MIDLHCHLLPGIDDGASNIEMSLLMAQQALADGTKFLVATPHIHPGIYDNSIHDINKAASTLFPIFKNAEIGLQVKVGAEVHLCPEIMLWAEKNLLPFIGYYQRKKVLLLEFPHGHIPPGSEKLIKWLLANNILPMIAHPERNRDIWREPRKLQPFIKLGCLMQITAGSLTGHFRESSRNTAIALISEGYAHVIASDGHNIDRRPATLSSGVNIVKKLFGNNQAQMMSYHTPNEIIQMPS